MGRHRTVEEILQSKVKTTLYLPTEIYEGIKRLSEKNRRSFNSEVVVAIEIYIKRQK